MVCLSEETAPLQEASSEEHVVECNTTIIFLQISADSGETDYYLSVGMETSSLRLLGWC